MQENKMLTSIPLHLMIVLPDHSHGLTFCEHQQSDTTQTKTFPRSVWGCQFINNSGTLLSIQILSLLFFSKTKLNAKSRGGCLIIRYLRPPAAGIPINSSREYLEVRSAPTRFSKSKMDSKLDFAFALIFTSRMVLICPPVSRHSQQLELSDRPTDIPSPNPMNRSLERSVFHWSAPHGNRIQFLLLNSIAINFPPTILRRAQIHHLTAGRHF
jgi:hypothetical protein